MKSLYNELLERMKFLENETEINESRIAELQLIIIRVQQILLSELKPK